MKNLLDKTGVIDSNTKNILDWSETSRRKWCNDNFRNAIPDPIRSCFKQFKCIYTTIDKKVTTTDDYFALPAEKEVMGSVRYSSKDEADSLIQFEYYKNAYNKYKVSAAGGRPEYWTRSFANKDYSMDHFCLTNGVFFDYNVIYNDSFGISPFGCI